TPIVRSHCFGMRPDHSSASFLADAYCFFDRIQHRGRARLIDTWLIPSGIGRLTALMYGVDAAIRNNLADQFDDFRRSAPNAWHILEPSRHAESFILHAKPHQLAHPCDFRCSRRTFVIVLHGKPADCTVA